jgi:hypothetical protein
VGGGGSEKEAENIVQFTLTLFSPAAGTSYTTKPSDLLINTYWGEKKEMFLAGCSALFCNL